MVSKDCKAIWPSAGTLPAVSAASARADARPSTSETPAHPAPSRRPGSTSESVEHGPGVSTLRACSEEVEGLTAGGCDVLELDEIDPALPQLALGDPGLGSTDLGGDVRLREPGIDARAP